MKVKFSILTTGILAGILCFAVSCNDVGDLEGRVGNLEQQVKDLKGTEVASLANQVKALNEFKAALEGLNIPEKYSDLLKQIGELQGGLSGVQNDVADILATMAKNNDLLALVGRVDKIENEQIANILLRLGAAEGDIQKIEGDITGLTNDLNKANDRIAAIEAIDVEGKLTAINEEIQKLWDKIGEILTQAGIDEEKIAKLEEDFGKAKERLDDAENNIKDLKQKLETAQADINDILNTTIPAINSRIDEQVKKLQEAQADIAKKADQTYVDQKFKELTEGTIKTIQDAVSSLDGKVAGLETVIGTVQNRINGISDSVKTNAEDIKTNAENIKTNAEDIAKALDQIKGLGEQISSLRGELMGEIGKINAKFNDYVLTSTFNQFKKTVYTKTQIDGVIDELIDLIIGNDYYILDYVDSIGSAHSDSIAKHLARIEALEDANTQINGEIDNLWSKIGDLEEADEKLEERMKNALTHAMDSLDTYVIGELPEGLTIAAILADHEQAISDIQDSIDAINGRVAEINGRLVDVEDLLKNRIQSLVYVPDYDDGKITINTVTIKGEQGKSIMLTDYKTAINYQVKPAELVNDVVNAWKADSLFLSYDVTDVEHRHTRVTQGLALVVDSVALVNAEKGIFTVFVTTPNASTIADANSSAVSLVLSDMKGNSRTTEYTMTINDNMELEVVAKPSFDTLISREYNDTASFVYFTSEDMKLQLDGKKKSHKQRKTVAEWEEELGCDLQQYIKDTIVFSLDGISTSEIYKYNIGTNDALAAKKTVEFGLKDDKTKTVNAVGDTITIEKKMYLVDGNDTICRARSIGKFAVTPIKLRAKLNAYINWNLVADAKGDVYSVRGRGIADYKHYENTTDSIVVDYTNTNINESGYTFANYSHQDTVPGSLKRWKVVDGDTTEIAKNVTNECAISKITMKDVNGTPEFSFIMTGIDFANADKYIVEAQYLPMNADGSIGKDTTTITIDINIQDRDRDVIIKHTYPTINLDVDKDFGGDTVLYLQSSDDNIEWSYFAALLDSLNQPDTLKYSDFTKEYDVTQLGQRSYAKIYSNKNANKVTFVNINDSIKLTVNYSKDDIDKANPNGFTIKDTLVNGAGQKIAIEIPFSLNWPQYDFYRNRFFVKDTLDGYHSWVEPNYKYRANDGEPFVYRKDTLTEYDVMNIDMKRNFSIVTIQNGQIVTKNNEVVLNDTIGKGLSVKYSFRNPGNKTISASIDEQSGIISYKDSLDTLIPHADLYMTIDGEEFKLPTNFDENGDYYNYTLHKYMPFKYFGKKTSKSAEIQISALGLYQVNLREYMSLIDTRDFECLDIYWIEGNDDNGFANGVSAKKAYGIKGSEVFTITTDGIPVELRNHLKFEKVDNYHFMLTFDYTGEVKLMEDIEIPVNYTFNSIYTGTMQAEPFKIVFKKPQQN